MIVLNVGGGENRTLPSHYKGWDQHILDIDPNVKPDILCDARKMEYSVQPEGYDAVYCSHNLEHFFLHEIESVFKGFLHVLKPHGKAEITVPNFKKAIELMTSRRLDLHDPWYRLSDGCPITFHDAIFGNSGIISDGNHFYAHKCAFMGPSLAKAIVKSGFSGVHVWEDDFTLYATAYKGEAPETPLHPYFSPV